MYKIRYFDFYLCIKGFSIFNIRTAIINCLLTLQQRSRNGNYDRIRLARTGSSFIYFINKKHVVKNLSRTFEHSSKLKGN